jgi:hypothetical protein
LSDRSAVPKQGEQNNRAVNIRQGRSRDGLAHQARGRIRIARSGQRCGLLAFLVRLTLARHRSHISVILTLAALRECRCAAAR